MTRGVAGRPQQSIKTGKSFALAEWFNKNVDFLTDLTNEQLAEKLGYTRPNIISMWRTGRTRIPLDRLVPLSQILKVDISFMLPLWVEQYGGGEAYAAVMKALNNSVSDNEMKLVEALRQTTKGRDFSVKKDAAKKLPDLITMK
ncbi:MAG: helix-turn-helix domain-containing protein [Hyphomonas sp.]|nr:helix-turn-helix domain-containing protein [Hyphomonas sp.]